MTMGAVIIVLANIGLAVLSCFTPSDTKMGQ